MTGALNCLVTGAGGFIGRHLTCRLVQDGHNVRTLVRSATDHPETKEFVGDIRDAELVKAAVEDTDVVFHLSSLNRAGRDEIQRLYETNVMGTLILAEAISQNANMSNRACKLVFFSTGQAYSSSSGAPVDERTPTRGGNFYVASKLAGEGIVSAGMRSGSFSGSILRLFNTYGPGQSKETLITSAIAKFCQASEITLGNLAPQRDFVFVSDVVESAIKAAFSDTRPSAIFNIGSGVKTEIRTVAETIGKLIHPDVPIRVKQSENLQRPMHAETDDYCADIALAAAELGWRPAVSLQDGLLHTIDWWRGRTR